MKINLFKQLATFVIIFLAMPALAQLPPAFHSEEVSVVRSSNLTKKLLTPVRVVWTSDTTGKQVKNTEKY